MSVFILVHGAWHGSWCWKHVRQQLRDLGHEVFSPTLTGLGERSHLLDLSVSVETHVDDIANLLIWEELEDVVLVAHSYGGFVARHVADRLPQRIRQLVYVDAFVPDDGRSLVDYAPTFAQMFRDGARDQGDGWKVPPVPSRIFAVNSKDAAWVDRQCTPHPLTTFETPARLGTQDNAVPAAYILAGEFPDSPFSRFAAAAREQGWACHTLPGGHDLMLDCPADLAGLLHRLGGGQGPSDGGAIEMSPPQPRGLPG